MLRRHRRPRRPSTANRNSADAVVANRYRVDALAERQHGLVTWGQLRRRGMAKAALTRAIASGRLHPIHPAVYSIVPPPLMGDLTWHAAAVLAGGPGACLCGPSAAWWHGLAQRPAAIHVAVTSARTARAGLRWHRPHLREDERCVLRAMPVTVPARVPLDLAATTGAWELRGLLAELEYRCGVGPEDVAALLRPGLRGGAALREAIAAHTPALAQTRGHLERAFAAFLVARGFVLPRFNHPAGKSTVDAIYEEPRLAIELDGVRGHSGERRVLRDHRRDVHRRAGGYLPLRYHFTQITVPADQALVEAELDRLGVPRLGDELGR